MEVGGLEKFIEDYQTSNHLDKKQSSYSKKPSRSEEGWGRGSVMLSLAASALATLTAYYFREDINTMYQANRSILEYSVNGGIFGSLWGMGLVTAKVIKDGQNGKKTRVRNYGKMMFYGVVGGFAGGAAATSVLPEKFEMDTFGEYLVRPALGGLSGSLVLNSLMASLE